ncbi:hypothetical protein D3C73_1125190 [compost metagenome]
MLASLRSVCSVNISRLSFRLRCCRSGICDSASGKRVTLFPSSSNRVRFLKGLRKYASSSPASMSLTWRVRTWATSCSVSVGNGPTGLRSRVSVVYGWLAGQRGGATRRQQFSRALATWRRLTLKSLSRPGRPAICATSSRQACSDLRKASSCCLSSRIRLICAIGVLPALSRKAAACVSVYKG